MDRGSNNTKTAAQAIIIILIIVFCLSRIIYIFDNYKEGFHCDEAWSYGFANSLYYPHIYTSEVDILKADDSIINYNSWISGKIFYDYLVVNEGESFRFDSVLYNKSGDMSPSFYEMLLHGVCSLFPEKFSWWFGFSINIVAFILIEVLIFFICKKSTGDFGFSSFVMLFYGLTIGAVSTIIYLRMYALLTMFTLLSIYLFQSICEQSKAKWYQYVCLAITAGLGSYTHFYYLLFAFIFTLLFCFFLLTKREVKKCFSIGFSMLAGVLVYFVLYPYAIRMLLASGSMYDNSIDYPFSWIFPFCIDLLLKETFGIRWTLDKSSLLYAAFTLFIITIIFVATLFVFRNDRWLVEIKGTLKIKLTDFKKNHIIRKRKYIEKWNPLVLCMIISVMGSITTVSIVSNVEIMGTTANRYIFNLYPVLIISFFIIAYRAIGKISKGRVGITLVFFVVMSLSLYIQCLHTRDIAYLFNKGDNKTDIHRILEKKDVIVVSKMPYRMEWYSVILQESNSVLFINPLDLSSASAALNGLSKEGEIYLVVTATDFILEEAIDKETGNISYEMSDIGNWNNTQTEADFYSELESINPVFANKEFQFSQDSFCGELKIYKIKSN